MAPAAAIGRVDHHSVTLEFDMGKNACTGHRSKREMAALVALEEYPYGLQAEGKLSDPAGGSPYCQRRRRFDPVPPMGKG